MNARTEADLAAEASPPSVIVAMAVAEELAPALEAWRLRLNSAGVACRAVAFDSEDERWRHPFPASEPLLSKTWTALRARVSPEQPFVLGKVEGSPAHEMMAATAVQLPTGRRGTVAAVLAPPHSERTLQLVMLSLGWLQLSLASASLVHNHRAAQLLEVLGHVASQREARAGAQEWINRTAAWARDQVAARAPAISSLQFSLSLFEVRRGALRWWVGADTAWAEKGSAAVQEAADVASRALAETAEVSAAPWWALPVLENGETVAVMVARCGDSSSEVMPAELSTLLRASVNLAEPLLRHWRDADRGLVRHVADAARGAGRKLVGPGHLTWKVGGLAALGTLAVLLLWPVTDRINANAVIEGRVRQVVTAPFEGFIAQAWIRPGAQVRRGDALARLDDRDLRLEQRKHQGERDQAAGKLRQAMAERDAPAMAVASAELQQAEAGLALVDAKLARAELLAPLDGIVVSGDWAQQIGAPIEAGKEMFEIAGSDGYRVVLHVPDHDIARVRVGQGGSLRLTGQPQTAYRFRIVNVTATAAVQDSVNGFRVEAAWEGDVPPLSPGMQGVGKVEVGEANLFTVWTRSSIDWLRMKLWSWWW